MWNLTVTKYQDFYHCGTVLGITSDLLYSSNSKTYGKEARYNQPRPQGTFLAREKRPGDEVAI